MIGIILLFSLLTGLLTKAPNLVAAGDQRNLLGVGDFAGVFSALAGIMAVTSEYRYGTIRPTFLFTPKRTRVLEAKVAAGLLAGAVFGIVGGGLGFLSGYACLVGRGIDFALDGRQIALLLVATIAGSALWGGIGVGLGAIVRSQVGAIIALLAWGFVAENLVFAFLPGIGRFGPVHAEDGLIEFTTAHLLGPVPGGLVLVAWAAALSVLGTAFAIRRDVN
jgi:ABC-type transport system involved in multi-copper enzyme maturation permease subunit